MISSTAPAEFYTANARYVSSIMYARGITDVADQEDVYHDFMLDILKRNTLARADSSGHPDAYITKCFYNHISSYYRIWDQTTKVNPLYLADYTTSTDSSAAIFTQLSIDEFRAWCPSRPALEACKEILEGKPESGSNYRAFQRHRNQFRKIHGEKNGPL